MRKLILFSILFLAVTGMGGAANVALDGTATSSPDGWGWVASNVIDDDNGTGFHSSNQVAGNWLEVDLGASFSLERIEFQNRGEYQDRINGCVVTAMDADRNIIAQSNPISGAPDNWVWDNDGLGFASARYIRAEQTVDTFLCCMEFRAIQRFPGATNQTPTNGTIDMDDQFGIDLVWETALDPNDMPNNYPGLTGHYVFFGTDPENLLQQGGLLPVETETYHVAASSLTPGTTYYWRIDERLESDSAILTGYTWTFSLWGKVDSPDPADGAERIGQDTSLGWRAASLSGISYDVYLAKDGEALAFQGNVETNSFTPASPLTDPNTVYNWRIDSISDGRTSAGDVWSLRTGGILSNFSPANGSGGISALPTLSWIGDSTGSYIDEVDIYMGDSPGSLALIATVTELSYQVLTELPEATTKYWQAVPKHGGVEIPGSASQVLSFTTGNLLAHWPMGTTDDVVSGLTTTIVKKTTEAADPTVIPGIVGDATLFAGDACYALDSASLWDNTGNGLAISAWVKWDMMSDDTDRGLMWSPFVTRSNGPEGSNGWSLQLYKYYFRPQLRTGSENMTAGEMYDFESVWHHIVAVYAPSGRQMWIDGVLVREYDGVAPFGLVDAPVSIGGRVTDADVLENGFIGAIDEVYVYDRIVSEPEALDLYKISPMAKLPDPAHGETGVAYDEQLTWVPGTTGGIAKQTLSYGMAPDLSDATVVTDLAADASSFTLPGNMELGENYFWKVDSIASDDSVIWEGPIWSFAVMELVGDIVVNKIVDIDDLKAVAAEWTDNSRSIPSVAMLPWAEPLTVGNIDNYLYSAAGYYQKSWWELGTPETDPNGFFTPVSDVSAVWHFDYPGTPWSTGGEIYGGFDLPEPISLENVNMVTFWVRPVNVPDADYYHPPAWLQGYCNDGAANFAWPLLQPKDPETGELIGWTEASAANDGTGKWVKMEWWTGSHSQTFGGIGFWTNWSGTNPQQPAHFEFGDIELTYANGLDPVCWIGSDLSDADFNKDCDVDLYDFAIFAGNWLVDAN